MTHAAPDDPALPGVVFPAGGATPPSTTDKASAAAVYGLGPVLLGALIEVLNQAGVIFPDADPLWLRIIALVLVVLGPVASYYGAFRTPNLLRQPVQVVDADLDPGLPPR